MRTQWPIRSSSPQLLAWCVFAAIAGLCSLVLPPYISEGGLPDPPYGSPLIPWFALAWANVRSGASALCFLSLGLALGLAQPKRWWVLALAATVFPPLLLTINIIFDWTRDPTSHNLFPFEFLVCAIISSPVLVGAFLGFLSRRLLHGRHLT
jgi:hypothetical protein